MALTRPWASCAALIACLVSFSANSGFWAMRSAMARPNASSSARGTTWLTMPSRCASAAPIQSAVNRNSLALRTPSSQGWAKNSAPPTPIATVWSRNSASSEADDQVARPDQHQAAGDHLALHQRHGRLGDVAPALAEADVDLLLARVLRLGARLAEARPRAHRLVLAHVAVAVDLAQVVARGEVRAVGRQHDHLDRVVLRGAVEGVVQGVEERGVLRVPGVGAVEDDAGDAGWQGLVEDGVGHGRLPVFSRA